MSEEILSDETSEKIFNNTVESDFGKVEELLDNGKEKASSNTTIFRGALMITNICFGVTLFTFASRAIHFGLIWLIIFCIIVGFITYWAMIRAVYVSSKNTSDDYSEITEKILGKKWRYFLNFSIITCHYGIMMMYMVMIYSLLGRFIHAVGYTSDYPDFDNFSEEIWSRAYIKFPVYIGFTIGLSFMCLIKDINKLNFSAYIGVFSVVYSLIVVLIECSGYYQNSKEKYYKEDDESTHINWINLGKAFTSKLEFFKGIASLICATGCLPGTFPIYVGFKYQKDGYKKMKWTCILGMLMTISIYVLSMVISFITNPFQPDDVIIYRKSKGGNDIAMTIAKLCVTLSLVFTYPAVYFVVRLIVANSFTKGHISKKFNILYTFISCFICSIIASVYDKILNYLNYIGGFLMVYNGYLIPVLLYIKINGKPFTYWKNILELIGGIIICLIGTIAGILTIIDDIS